MSANSTVELMTLWASSSPSLVVFCFSHVIIAILLLGGRGCAPGVSGRADEHVVECSAAETPDAAAAQIQGSKRNSGGHDNAAIVTLTAIDGRGSPPEAHCRAEERSVGVGEVDAAAFRTQAGGNVGGQEDVSIAVVASWSEEKCGEGDGEEDELTRRAEEFIQRMNRAWRTESVRVC